MNEDSCLEIPTWNVQHMNMHRAHNRYNRPSCFNTHHWLSLSVFLCVHSWTIILFLLAALSHFIWWWWSSSSLLLLLLSRLRWLLCSSLEFLTFTRFSLSVFFSLSKFSLPMKNCCYCYYCCPSCKFIDFGKKNLSNFIYLIHFENKHWLHRVGQPQTELTKKSEYDIFSSQGVLLLYYIWFTHFHTLKIFA